VSLLLAISLSQASWLTPEVRAPGVSQHLLSSKLVQSKVSYHVFLPNDYEAKPEQRFPVLYWLHGSGGGLPGIPPVSAFFGSAMRAGKLPAMILVFPNSFANGMWCDSVDGKQPIESMVIRELIPEVDRKFRTIDKREGRIVEGFSMGGYGAARFGFKYPDLFVGVSMLAAGPLDLEFMGPKAAANANLREGILDRVFGGDIENYKAQSPWMLAKAFVARGRARPTLRMVIGERDFTLSDNKAFSEHLKGLRIPHTFLTQPGVGHETLALLRAMGDENWAFYRDCLKPN
jgi:enterochelin esterase-like enzyme